MKKSIMMLATILITSGFSQGLHAQNRVIDGNALSVLPRAENVTAAVTRHAEILANGVPYSTQGFLEINIGENFVSPSSLDYLLHTTSGRTFRLYVEDSQIQGLRSGDLLAIQGRVSRLEIAVTSLQALSTSGATASTQTAASLNRVGPHKLLVILANFQNRPHQKPFTREDVFREVLDGRNPESMATFIRANSYGKASVGGTVIDWVTLPLTSTSCTYQTLRSAAIQAVDPLVNFATEAYYGILVLVPDAADIPDDCGYGRSTFNQIPVTTQDGTVPLALMHIRVYDLNDPYNSGGIKHEFGHALGLYHANDLECGSSPIGQCNSLQYGNVFNAMGSSIYWGANHYDSVHKDKLGWFSSTEVRQVQYAGIYYLYPLETSTTRVLKTLKIPHPQGYTWYIDYRKPLNFDADIYNFFSPIVPGLYDGLFFSILWEIQAQTGGESHLVDFSPHYQSQILYPDYINSEVDPHFLDSLASIFPRGFTLTENSLGFSVKQTAVYNHMTEVTVKSTRCGNGDRDAFEQCDDRNLQSGDGCNSLCQIESCSNDVYVCPNRSSVTRDVLNSCRFFPCPSYCGDNYCDMKGGETSSSCAADCRIIKREESEPLEPVVPGPAPIPGP